MWEILGGLGGLAAIVALFIMPKGVPKQWRIWDWTKRPAHLDQVLVLLADIEFDTDGRWTAAISEELARLKKRQRRLGRAVSATIDKQGQLTLDNGMDTLRRHGCDVLICGRVQPDGYSAFVRVMNKHDGVVDQVILTGEKESEGYVETMAKLNLAIEEGIARNIDREGLLGEDSDKAISALEVTRERLEEFGKQAIHPKSERYANINRAALEIKIGDQGGSTKNLSDARETMKVAHQSEWYGKEDNTAAVQIANSLVFEARIERDEGKLKQARDWYNVAANQALATEDYKKWIAAYNCVTWTAAEIYQSNGEKSWLEKAKLEQIHALEICKRHLTEEEYREARGVMAGIRLLLASLEGNGEDVLEAVEEVRATGMYEMLAQINGVGGSAIVRGLMQGSIDEVEYWSKECDRIDKDAEPQEWALAQNRRGIALAESGERSGNVEQLMEGERAVGKALSVWTEQRWPLKYALAMDNLGLMFRAKYTITGDKSMLENAVNAHEQALTYRSRNVAPREWITTVRNMGSSLVDLAETCGDSEIAREATVILGEAVEECIRLEEKFLELEVTLNLGLAYDVLAELSGRGEFLDEAIQSLETAMEGIGDGLDKGARQGICERIENLKKRRRTLHLQ